MNEPFVPRPGWTLGPPSFVNGPPVQVVDVDCSDCVQLLEIVVDAGGGMTPETQATLTKGLLDAVNALDRARGGSGFRYLGAKADGTQVIVILVPAEPEQATERIAAVCAALRNDGRVLDARRVA